MPNLRSRTVVAERLWDWAFINECIKPTQIKASDVDGEVERNGFILRIEAKPMGFKLTTAQQIWFRSLLRLRRPGPHDTHIKAFTIIVLYGEPSVPEAMQIWPDEIRSCTMTDVQTFVRSWFTWASSQPRDEIR